MFEDSPEPDFRAVSRVALRIPPDRPDTLLLELQTSHGPFRFGMTQAIALEVAERIRTNALLLKTGRPALGDDEVEG